MLKETGNAVLRVAPVASQVPHPVLHAIMKYLFKYLNFISSETYERSFTGLYLC